MPRHMEAWMDGVQLSSLGDILIQQVYENAPSMEEVTGEIPGRYGQRLFTHDRQTLSVAIEMAIRERFDLAMRSNIAQEIRRWCAGSVLELSNHPGQQLRVVCTALPQLGEVRNYAANLRAEFTAYDNPFWEETVPVTETASGTSGNVALFVPGSAPYMPVDITVSPAEGTLTSFYVRADHGGNITLNDISVAAGGTLTFSRGIRDTLMIRANGASCMSKRTISSSDDLLVIPGSNTINFTANVSCDVTVSIRGRWL